MARHSFAKGLAVGIAVSIGLTVLLVLALPEIYLATENRNFAKLREKSKLDCTTMPLHCLARDGDLEGIAAYARAGRDLELRDNWGRSALYWSLTSDRPGVSEQLLAVGADPNTKEENGLPLLLQAVVWDRFDFAASLLDKGADIDAFSGGRYPETALHHCVMKNKIDCVGFLIGHGADVSLKDAFGYTVFERVRMHQHIDPQIGALLVRPETTTH